MAMHNIVALFVLFPQVIFTGNSSSGV